MAPSPATEDYYFILEVEQIAELAEITTSYRQLALKHHPDRNLASDTTSAFQALERAYETLKDAAKRRDYNIVYHRLRRDPPSTSKQQSDASKKPNPEPAPPPAPKPQVLSETVQIESLWKVIQECGAWWQTTKVPLSVTLLKYEKAISELKQQIKDLIAIAQAESAEDEYKKSWGAWIISGLKMERAESEEEKLQKDRKRKERRLEKDMKERRLARQEAELKIEKAGLARVKETVYAANQAAFDKILALEAIIDTIKQREHMKADAERQAKESVLKEERRKVEKAAAEFRRRREEEAAETLRKVQKAAAEKEEHRRCREAARQQLLQQEQEDRRTLLRRQEVQAENNRRWLRETCCHKGWWDKVEGRSACPQCDDVWNYLLECPHCDTQACPKCQCDIRQRNNRARFEGSEGQRSGNNFFPSRSCA